VTATLPGVTSETPRQPEVGPVGRNLIANVERLRAGRRLTYKRLSELLKDAGRPIFPLGLSRLEKAERRVDVDELVAFASVFGVDPAELLRDPGEAAQAGDHRAVREAQALTDQVACLVAAGSDPAVAARIGDRVNRALRRVAIEVEELLAGEPPP
jgi:transcriptional regulator with XRE-family HTH domain